MKQISKFSVFCLVFGSLFGCTQEEANQKDEPVTLSEVKKETQEAVRASARFVDQQKTRKVQELNQKFRSLQKQLDALHAEAKNELSEDMGTVVQDLQSRQNSFETALRQFEGKTDEAWEDTVVDLENAFEELQQGYARAFDQLGLEVPASHEEFNADLDAPKRDDQSAKPPVEASR